MLQYYDVNIELYREGKLIYKATVPKIKEEEEFGPRNVPVNWSNAEKIAKSLGEDSPFWVDNSHLPNKCIRFNHKLIHGVGMTKPIYRNLEPQTHLFFRTFPMKKIPSLYNLLQYPDPERTNIVNTYIKTTYDKLV